MKHINDLVLAIASISAADSVRDGANAVLQAIDNLAQELQADFGKFEATNEVQVAFSFLGAGSVKVVMAELYDVEADELCERVVTFWLVVNDDGEIIDIDVE